MGHIFLFFCIMRKRVRLGAVHSQGGGSLSSVDILQTKRAGVLQTRTSALLVQKTSDFL